MKHFGVFGLLTCLVLLLPGCGDDRVINANQPPVLMTIGPQSLTEEQPFSLSVAVVDPADIVELTATGLPEDATFDRATGKFQWTPPLGSAGTYEVEFRAFDGIAEASETIRLTVAASPPGAPTRIAGITAFAQNIPVEDSGWSSSLGRANFWDIQADFSLEDGSRDQFDGALRLLVNNQNFPWDQAYEELVFRAPLVTETEGFHPIVIDVGAFYSNPADQFSALLNATAGARLQQTIDLSTATGPLTFSIQGYFSPSSWWGNFQSNNLANSPYFKVVLRSQDGTVLRTIFEPTSGLNSFHTIDFTPETMGQAVLSVEWRCDNRIYSVNSLNDLSLRDSNGREILINGGFETGDMRGWTVSHRDVQNMTSGKRSLSGLKVSRSFYTQPNQLWGRWVDEFENPTATDIRATIKYGTNLGSDGGGIIYFTPGTGGQALTIWDGYRYRRDVGMVFGTANRVNYSSATGMNLWDGSDIIATDFDVIVPANGRIAVANFILMNTRVTATSATSATATADQIDAAAQEIVNGFRTDPKYQTGLTREQIDAIINL